MAYTTQTWNDNAVGIPTASQINAARLGHIEDGISAEEAARAAADALLETQSHAASTYATQTALTAEGTVRAAADALLETQSHASSTYVAVAAAGTTVYARAHGVLADGTTNDAIALTNTQAFLPASGGVIEIQPGVVSMGGTGFVLSHSNMTVRGSGMNATTLRATTTGVIVQSSGSSRCSNIVFEDLCFDSARISVVAVALHGDDVQRVTFRRCRFINTGTQSLGITSVSALTVEDCVFESADGLASGTGLNVSQGCSTMRIRRNRFRYLGNGIIIGSVGGELAESIHIHDNDFEGGWYILPYVASGSGGTVTYTGTVMTDTGASLSITAPTNNVRVMPVRQAGTLTAVSGTKLTDSSALFVTTAVRRGEIVRSGSIFAVVSNVTSETELRVEEWLDDATRLPVSAPAVGATYTAYQVLIGRMASSTGTTITVDRFHDLDGNTVTPAAGSRYEVLPPRPNYMLNVNSGARNMQVTFNRVRRAWSDQISLFCSRAQIIGNHVRDGQDMGFTLHGSHNVVMGNRSIHNGTGGFYLDADFTDSVVADNVAVDNQWQNVVETTGKISGFILNGSLRNSIHDNIATRETSALCKYGISLYNAATGNKIHHNKSSGHLVSDIVINGSTAVANELDSNDGTLSYNNGGVGQVITTKGTGSPESVVTGSVGSLYRRTDGGAGTTVYTKESGTSSTGWNVLGATATPATNFLPVANVKANERFGTMYSVTSTQAMVLNNLYVTPVIIPVARTLIEISIKVTTNVATAVIRLGIYNDDGSGNLWPGSLLLDAGTVDASTATGIKAITISQAVTPGTYWLAAVAQTAAPTVTNISNGIINLPSNFSDAFTVTATGYSQAGVTGALGTWAGARTGNGGCPRVLLQAS